ncbi:MAG TPA: fluoride efflux transporter CrcB [Bacteroidales bacterium]|nr:fluoride efflux transporter CrcB [Bacteroidales bacterium]
MIKSMLIAGLGGFIGTVLRFVLSRLIQTQSLSLFPWSTFLINTAGCLLIGVFYGISEKGNLMPANLRLFLTVGLCGGFTTFSTFSNDAFLLIQDREWLRVSLFATLSFFLGLAAVYLGKIISKLF